MSLTFTVEDCKTPEKLERLFQLIRTELNNLQSGVSTAISPGSSSLQKLAAQLAPLIRDQLQAPGGTPLNLQSLLPVAGGTNLTAGDFLFGGGGSLVTDSGFSVVPIVSGGTGAGTASGARSNLSAALKGTPGVHTITLAALTGPGTQGSITWNADGVITAFVDPT